VSANDPTWDEQRWKRPPGGGDATGSPGGFPIPHGATPGGPATLGSPANPGGPATLGSPATSGGPSTGAPTSGGAGAPGDSAWSRGAAAGEPPAYTGPPRPIPGSAATAPPTVIRAAPPRKLPEQDIAALDADERQARTLTYGVGMITGAVALLVLFVLCGRILF